MPALLGGGGGLFLGGGEGSGASGGRGMATEPPHSSPSRLTTLHTSISTPASVLRTTL